MKKTFDKRRLLPALTLATPLTLRFIDYSREVVRALHTPHPAKN